MAYQIRKDEKKLSRSGLYYRNTKLSDLNAVKSQPPVLANTDSLECQPQPRLNHSLSLGVGLLRSPTAPIISNPLVAASPPSQNPTPSPSRGVAEIGLTSIPSELPGVEGFASLSYNVRHNQHSAAQSQPTVVANTELLERQSQSLRVSLPGSSAAQTMSNSLVAESPTPTPLNSDAFSSSSSSNFEYTSVDDTFKFFYEKDETLQNNISLWLIKNHISGGPADELLFILRQQGYKDLPKSYKTIKKIKTKMVMKNMGSGAYFTRNLRALLINRLRVLEPHLVKDVYYFDLSSDGLPVGKSSNEQLWPYVLAFTNKEFKPIVWGCYSGNKKPSNPNEILKEFRLQIQELARYPVLINGKQVKFKFRKFKGDIPSISLHVGVKCPGGYSACRFCNVIGVYLSEFKKIVYPDIDAQPRTHQTYVAQANLKPTDTKQIHVIKKSEFLSFTDFDCVNNVDIDAMHLFLFGEVKKNVNKWYFIKNKARLPLNQRKLLEKQLSLTFKQFPCEFNRQGRKFDEINRWKATELKALLMYQFLVISSSLPTKIANHFMLLFCAARILSHPIFFKKYNKIAGRLLLSYVTECKDIYGVQHYDLVTHLLLHIAQNAATNPRPIFEESCFVFENELKCLKDALKAGPLPLQQVYNRLEEKENFIDKFEKRKSSIPKLNIEKDIIEFELFKLKPTLNDSFFINKQKQVLRYLKSKIIENQLHVVACQIPDLKSTFTKPFESSFIDIFSSKYDSSDHLVTININDISCKVFHLSPASDNHIYIPLEHTYDNEF